MLNRIKITLQYLLPKRYLSQLAGWFGEFEGGWITRWIIFLFIRVYKVDMYEVKHRNIKDYPTFNAFFIRNLRNDVRPIDKNPSVIVMPADGIISQIGIIKGEQIFQSKKNYYSLEELLVGNVSMITKFRNGSFSVIYLAPRDYHRVHMPCNGRLDEVIYVPGELFSVNPVIVENIPNVFSRNERLICLFETNFGPMIQILVGSVIVSSIETVWLDSIKSNHKGIIKYWSYPKKNSPNTIILLKGEEMGRFKLGSSVINLFVNGTVFLSNHLYPNYITRIGQHLAYGIAHKKNIFF